LCKATLLLLIGSNVSALQNKQALMHRNRQKHRYDESTDGIATSTADDMFAFSEIISSGEKVSAITQELERSSQTHTK
jgi:hypothetical protein